MGWIKITKSCLKVCFFTFIFLYIFYQSLFSRTCYEQLREDFQFNLAVLDERDRELARYDSLTAKALTVNRNRYSYHILYGPICVCWDAFFFFFLHFSYIVLFILHYPIWKKYNGYLFKKKKTQICCRTILWYLPSVWHLHSSVFIWHLYHDCYSLMFIHLRNRDKAGLQLSWFLIPKYLE